MKKLRFSILVEFPLRLANRLFYEPARRRRYLQAAREFDANCDRMAWLLAQAIADAVSSDVGAEYNRIMVRLSEQKVVVPFKTLVDRQEQLLESMRENLSDRTELSYRMAMARYDRLAVVAGLLP